MTISYNQNVIQKELLQITHQIKKFTTAREAYIGAQYGKKGIPRILFLSLDSGGGTNNPKEKSIKGMIKVIMHIKPKGIPKVRHWYKKNQFAWIIFDEINRRINLKWDIGQTNLKMLFEPELDRYKILPYLAHTNSAKCCMNNPNSKQANKTLFANCREYIPDEIKILSPHILVTQGAFARMAIDYGIKNSSFSKISSKKHLQCKFNQSRCHDY